jgi:rhomboid protease GluP
VTSNPQPVLMVRTDSGPPFSSPRTRPVATLAILGITVLVFLLEIVAGGSTNPGVLIELGAAYGPYIRRGEYWRLVMPMFLHAGPLHIALNAYALFLLGPLLERLYGYGRFSCLYVGSGIGASILSMWRSNSIAVGASGAIFGIMGAMVVIGYLHPETVPWRWHRLFGRRMIFLILISLALGPALDLTSRVLKLNLPRIDNWAHLGGLATGVALALLVPPPQPWEGGAFEESRQPSQAMVVIPIAIVALAVASGASHYRASRAVARLVEEGRRLREGHQDTLAVKRWQEAIRRAPLDERPHEELGWLYLEQGRNGEAIGEYSQALRLDPASEEAHLGLAAAYRKSGEVTKSRQLLEPVLKEDFPDAEDQESLADLFAKYKFYPEAIQHYQRTLELDPNLAIAHNNLAWLYATSDDPRFRNPAQALEHARRAVELSREKQPDYLDTLAEALYVNQNYNEAVKVETKALALTPENSEFKDHMARYRKAAGV